jgi:hypothetical protein
MKKMAWRTLAAIGVVTSLAVVGGCVVGSSSDNTGGSAGATSGGGSGGSTGGTGATGGTATGGTAGTASGGSAGAAAPYTCDPDGSLVTTPGSCVPSDSTDACQQCIQQKCCDEWEKCLGTNPNNACGWGGPKATDGTYPGEIFCYQDCYVNGGDKATCAGQCASDGCGTIASPTNDIITCLDTNCLVECFSP